MDDGRCTLYRVFDSEGELLYVGISWSASARLGAHLSTALWRHLADSVTFEHFGRREEAARAELRAIRDEHPRFNVIGARSTKGRKVRLTVDLPESLHRALRVRVAQQGGDAGSFIRALLTEALPIQMEAS